jgi:L,D-transpeptidase YcbB
MIANRLLVLIVLCGAGSKSASSAQAQVALSSEGQARLRTTISSGSSDLRWPDFSDYRKHVKKFYEFNGDSLWWVKGMEPTAQARQVIALMLQAGQKGLSADDYDYRSA